MKILKYLVGIWIALAIYTVFSFLGGARGMSAYNYLLAERDIQKENIKELGLLNDELEVTRNNLLFDEDTILVQARQMGFGEEGDR
ncbi:MAG: septum formation initiator family protein, partial [Treponema sp.]|nr:septum formation initiator family protein [Treponema sp.]